MPAKLLHFPDPPKKPAPAGEPIELPSISIAIGNQVYTLSLSACITEQRSGGQPAALPAKTSPPAAEKS